MPLGFFACAQNDKEMYYFFLDMVSVNDPKKAELDTVLRSIYALYFFFEMVNLGYTTRE